MVVVFSRGLCLSTESNSIQQVCISGPGHMTKKAAMPIYGRNNLKSSQTTKSSILKLGVQHQNFKFFKVTMTMTVEKV